MSKLAKQIARNQERNKKRADRNYSKCQVRRRVIPVYSEGLKSLCNSKGASSQTLLVSKEDSVVPYDYLDIYNM